MVRTKERTSTRDLLGIPGTQYKETVIYRASDGKVLGRGYGRNREESSRNALVDACTKKK